MLRYVEGGLAPGKGAVIRLARALERDRPLDRSLPALALRWPAFIRLLEPWRPSMQHSLSRRLHLAAVVAESPQRAPAGTPSMRRVIGQLMLEALVFPIRLVFGRLYA